MTQMGAELIGDGSVEADAEMISLVVEALLSTGLKNFQVTVGEVEYFKGLCEEAGLDEETELDLRALISGKNFFAAQELLIERGVEEPYQSRLLKVADLLGDMSSLADAETAAGNARSLTAIKRLEKLYSLLELYGLADYISFDLGMLSKYRYYTGVIFKAYTYGVGEAVVKGGRYDRLLSQFGRPSPAVGFVMVVDSILEAISRQNVALPETEEVKRVCYAPDNYPEKLTEILALRKNGIPAALVPDPGTSGEESR